MAMKDILNRMLNHEELTREETKNIILGITKSEFPEEQITALLTGLQMRGVTVDELLGFRDGILETGVPAILDCDRYIDVVGTGGDRKNTFNISTTSCFVIAGAGYNVAKHGNYAATSTSGASNVMENCILRRELSFNGKSRAFINDSPVQLNLLKDLGIKLIDIHSQHQNLLLGDNRFQMKEVDIMAD